MTQVDVIVIGAGIAGASAAAEIAADARVLVLEAEARPGHHATGRSAALFHLTYGGPVVQRLSEAAFAFFGAPPKGFADAPLTRPRGLLMVAPDGQQAMLERRAADASGAFAPVAPAEAEARFPALRPGWVRAAQVDETAADIDVDALHQGWLRRLKARGGEVVCDARVEALTREPGAWRVRAGGREFAAEVVVNAAGAWGDAVTALAGAAPLGLQPKRRTAAVIEAPEGVGRWPFLVDADETFYLKPDAGRLLLSPADETDVEPHDAWADEVALAEGIARMQAATTLTVERRPHAWAGLRTFAPDRVPVVGWDPTASGLFQLVGQGGFGVQTSPAVARLAADLLAGRTPAVDPAPYAPARFRG